MAVEVRNQAVDVPGRRTDCPLDHHPQFGLLATLAPELPRKAPVSTTIR
jgi:hypothetical protein